MSRLCRLRNAKHGDDGQWAYNEIVSLRRELKNMTDQYNAALEAEQVRYRQLAEARQEIADRKADCETGHDQDEATIAELRQQLAEKDAEIERLKGDTYAGLDIYPNNTESEQQRILVGSVEMGQLLERRKDEGAGNTKTQGIIVLAGIDEYGPILHWHTHWVDFEVGSEFYSDKQLAASLAREQQLLDLLPARTPGGFVSFGKNYAEAEDKFNDPRNPMCRFKRIYLDACEQALALPADTSALEAMIAKAGEVMRERCAKETDALRAMYRSQAVGAYDGTYDFKQIAAEEIIDEIRAIPGVTLEDLK